MSAKVLRVSALPTCLSLLFLIACGGSSSQVAISISPTTATLNAGMQQQFTATVTGTSNTSVQWQVNSVPGGNSQVGIITANGLYTAPTVDLTFQVTVTAVANANPSKTASAQVTVNGVGVAGDGGGNGGGGNGGAEVMISPTRAALTLTEPQQFTATVMGAPGQNATWSVDGIAGGNSSIGTVSSAGLYTPPSAAGTHMVTASLGSSGPSASKPRSTFADKPQPLPPHGLPGWPPYIFDHDIR